jgi:hypothetical protein
MEPGTGSPVVEGFFSVLVVLLFGVIALVIARTALLMSLLWIMPVAKLFSFVPGIRRWIDRKTSNG